VQTNASTSIAAFPSDTQLLTLQLQQGLSVAEIAQQRGFSPSTIINHLLELIEMNQPVDLNQLVLPVRQHLIVKAMEAVGTASLKSIYEHLKKAIPTMKFDWCELGGSDRKEVSC